MLKRNPSKFICFGSILIALTVIFQSAPVFLPAIGMALSPFSTLPIAIYAAINIPLGFIVFLSSVLIIAVISVEEALILLFTTGVLGFMIGILLFRKGLIISVLLSSIALTLGMLGLTYLIGVTAFVDFTRQISTPFILVAYFLFSVVYGCIWNIGIRNFMNYLIKIKLIK